MPELPEVETTLRGIAPHITGAVIREIIVRERRLRLPVTPDLADCHGRRISGISRRAKYLIIRLQPTGHWLVHLGMSGNLRVVPPDEPFRKHDHIAVTLSNGLQIRFHDPRRFGLFLYLPDGDPQDHPLLRDLGPEPLSADFTDTSLAAALHGRGIAIKIAIMDPRTVVGVGNIYASEALFRAGIRPQTPATKLSRQRITKLRDAIRAVLAESIAQGGTTLRDFLQSDGSPGYFRQSLNAYGRTGEPCHICGAKIRQATLGQRSTFWCPRCQR